ncbi:LLM class flavin-dependent oxidoreductase [Bordetella sp. N]|uniref:LLM class flavin-dependent oxidoreductase n=1 Tax=Bordetella sp. N TaxID=1746199 RepID=UPI000B33B3C4|nr:LLM class flavin-dependent oxidoreductase [Bordetella sp. N]
MASTIHLNLFVHGRGHHEAGWRHPSASRQPLTDIDYFASLARRAEEGKFDSVFFADYLALNDDIGHVAGAALEPITLLAALARATRHIGLIATVSTTYSEPFNIARQFASVDHISHGRAGWNIVTSWLPHASRNFGLNAPLALQDRYERAEEYVRTATQLWDSWADDAIVDDPQAGRYADLDRVGPIAHEGKHFSVNGPLNIPRSPQGWPVLVQAGSSPAGKAFAAKFAEAVFTAHLRKESAQQFYQELKTLTEQQGRKASQIVILPGLSATLGSTEHEARVLSRELNELTHFQVGLERLSNRFGGHDFTGINPDLPLSADDFPDAGAVQASQSRSKAIIELVTREHPTLRQLLHRLAGARGHFTLAGTPEQVADAILDWVDSGAADGFNVMPPVLPRQLDLFIEHVVPILQARGRFRKEYEHTTLRGHYGLDRPAGR